MAHSNTLLVRRLESWMFGHDTKLSNAQPVQPFFLFLALYKTPLIVQNCPALGVFIITFLLFLIQQLVFHRTF